MPVGLEVKDYDSGDGDVSSTEDDGLNLPVTNSSNKKIKKKKVIKKSILKESKFIKDKAKKKIKNMENEVKDIDSVNYLNNRVTFGEDEVREFVTDNELVEQFKELEKIRKMQNIQWNKSRMTHIPIPKMKERENVIQTNMVGMFKNIRKSANNSRTQKLNSSSIVNTTMPLMGGHRVINRNYTSIGRMW